MKQKLLNKLWLRVGMIVAIMTTALAGTAWAETKTEGFEAATASTTYNSTATIATNKSDCGIGWEIYYGNVSTTGAITGSKSCLLRYYSASSNNLGYAKTTTGIQGLTNVTFNAKVTNTGNKMGVWYSTDGSNWTALATEVTLTTNSASKSYDIPNSSTSTTYYIKIGITSATTNKKDLIIDDVVFTYSTGGTPTPSISASDVNIAFNADNGSITYTLSNATGNVTASVTEGDWLTLGTITSSAVPFTCSENSGKTARTATVTLSYTGASDKVVTVTQAGNPNAVDNISDITAAGTYTVRGTIVAKGQRGFIVGDGTGYVYYYNQNYTQSNYNIGDKVKLDGSVVVYGGVFEFNNSTTVTAATESNYVAEEPTVLTGSQMDTRVASTTPAELSTYVQYEGVLTVDGTHYNITSIDGASTAIGSISYPISTDFTSLNGKTVKVTGYYVGVSSSTYYNTMLESIEEVVNTDPVISASDVNIAYDATSGEIAYTIANPTDATLTAALTTGDWISNVTVDAVNNKVTFTATANEGNADRTATITLSYTGAQDKVVTVTQGHYVADYATLPFSFDGGKADIENTAGLTETGIGSDYGSSPKLKFDTTGDELILKINERPGVLTFDIKNNSFSGGTFKVQTSVDGDTYTDLKVYSSITGTQNEEFTNLDANVRYIKWVYTNKSSGNVALGNIELAEYVYIPPVINAESPVALAFNATAGEIPYTIKNPVDGVSLTATESADWISNIAVTADKVTFTATANEGDERSATITLSYTGAEDKEVTVTQAAYVAPFASTTWTLATSITSGKHYIIVNNASEKAMGAQGNNNRAAVGVDIEDETATVSSADVQEFVIYGPDAAGFYTIYDGTGYLYAASSGSNHLKTKATVDDDARWAISFGEGGVASIVATKSSNHNVMQYNNGSTLFSCYSSASQFAVSLYEKAGEAAPTESVTVGNLSYATFASDNALDFTSSSIKAFYATESAGTLSFTQVTKVPAGTGVLLYKDGGATESVPALTGAADAVTGNVFVRGAGVAVTYTDNDQNYILFNGADGIGFYKANNNNVATNRAYIHVTSSNPVKSFAIDLDDDATGIEETLSNSPLKGENIYNLAGQMVNGKSVNGKLPKGIYIVNGKKIMVK